MSPFLFNLLCMIVVAVITVVAVVIFISRNLDLEDSLNTFYASLDRYQSYISKAREETEQLRNTGVEIHTYVADSYEPLLTRYLNEVQTAFEALPARGQHRVLKESLVFPWTIPATRIDRQALNTFMVRCALHGNPQNALVVE